MTHSAAELREALALVCRQRREQSLDHQGRLWPARLHPRVRGAPRSALLDNTQSSSPSSYKTVVRRVCSKPIAHNDVIRLQHLATGKNLHSHNFPAPLSESAGLEVSCFGENGNGDAGDDWVVDLPARSGLWARGEIVRFKHLVTKVHRAPRRRRTRERD